MNYKYSEFKHGQDITFEHEGKKAKGKISIGSRGNVYVCQNFEDGAVAEDRLGFRYSWIIISTKGNDFTGSGNIKDLKLGKAGKSPKEKPVLFVVKYDLTCGDPCEVFTSKTDLVKWLKEARDNTDIVFSSIRVFPVSGELKVGLSVTLRSK